MTRDPFASEIADLESALEILHERLAELESVLKELANVEVPGRPVLDKSKQN